MNEHEAYYVEIDPIDKISDLCHLLKDDTYEIHKCGDTGYEYLEDESVCITVLNPYSEQTMEINIEDEFTLCYNAFHSHYAPYAGEYEEMVTLLRKILDNEICCASLYSGESRKWLGSICVSREDTLHASIKNIFSFVLKSPEFKQKLKTEGGQAHFCFWNPAYDSVIQIPKKDEASGKY